MTSIMEVLQEAYAKLKNQVNYLTETGEKMSRHLTMGARWLTDNEALIRAEYPTIFVVPSQEDVARGGAESEAGGKDALIDKQDKELKALMVELGEERDQLAKSQATVAELDNVLELQKVELAQAGEKISGLVVELASTTEGRDAALQTLADQHNAKTPSATVTS